MTRRLNFESGSQFQGIAQAIHGISPRWARVFDCGYGVAAINELLALAVRL